MRAGGSAPKSGRQRAGQAGDRAGAGRGHCADRTPPSAGHLTAPRSRRGPHLRKTQAAEGEKLRGKGFRETESRPALYTPNPRPVSLGSWISVLC